MTATAIARNGGGRSDNNGGVDVRVKLKSEKGSSPNTSMAGGNDTSSASTTLSNQSSGGSSQGTANGVIAEREHHLAAQYREQKEEERKSESDDGSPMHCSSQVKEYQKQQLMTQQDEQEQHQRDMMDANQQQPRPHSAMTLHPTLGSNGSVSSFQQHHYAQSETFGDVPQMIGHRLIQGNNTINNNVGSGNGGVISGNNPAMKNVVSMSSANYLQKSVSCQRIDEMLRDSMDAFHRDGPLVSPLCRVKPGGSERHKNRHAFGGETAFSGGSWMVDSPMRDRMSYVCESKGFDYGIFWKLDRQRTSLMPDESVISPRIATDTSKLKLFVNTSKTLFTRYVLGFGRSRLSLRKLRVARRHFLVTGMVFSAKSPSRKSWIENHNLRPGGKRRRRIRFNRRDGSQRQHRPVCSKDVQIVSLFAVVSERRRRRKEICYFLLSLLLRHQHSRQKKRDRCSFFLCAQRNVFLSSTATMKTQIVTPRIVKLVATTSPQLRARQKEREREGSLRELLLS